MAMRVYDPTVNYLKDPVGLDSAPRFSWKLDGGGRGQAQAAYRLRVAPAQGGAAVWDTGWVESADNVLVPYGGPELAPLSGYRWSVSCRDTAGARGETAASFITGKKGGRWEANWITAGFIRREDSAYAAPYLRRSFRLERPVERALLCICGLGFFEAFLNGEKIGDDMLSPAYTRYDITDLYRTYDLSGRLRQGENVLAVSLGNGMYNCFSDDPWNSRQATWRHWPKVIAELNLTFDDGTARVIGTRRDWKSSKGPIVFNGLRHGEHYDARLEQPGWNDRGFDDSAWQDAQIIRAPGGVLRAMEVEPVRVRRVFPAVRMWQTSRGWVFDVGQNQAGIGNFVFRGPAGSQITIRYSDLLTPEGELDQGPICNFIKNFTFQTDRYIKKSDGEERWHPVFVYHGFQYIEISGIDYKPQLSDAEALTLFTGFDSRGTFECSDRVLNQVQHMCRWSTLSNAFGVFQSDPHREKNSWTGDGSVSSEQFLINFGAQPLLTKWLGDIRESQRPGGSIPCVVPSTGWGYNSMNGPDWSSALPDIPWYIYLYNADRQVLAQNYESIKCHCAYMESMSDGYLVHYGLGDWCAPFDGPALSVNMGSFQCPTEVTDTAYFYSAARRVADMARILGRAEDEACYAALAGHIRAAFRAAFFDRATMTVKGSCQTATAVMVYHGLAEPDEIDGLMKRLLGQIREKGGHLDFGILGMKAVLHSLGDRGLAGVGIRMLTQETYPSCKRWVDMGANTMWECWNALGSHNHHMFSDLSAFFYKYVAGVAPDPAEPGFRHIVFRPAVGCGLEQARAEVESMHGAILCDWTWRGGQLAVRLRVPAGCHATLHLPEAFGPSLTEGGTPAARSEWLRLGHDREGLTAEMVGGSYELAARADENFRAAGVGEAIGA